MARLLVIDTETGGIDPGVHSILSLAAVVWEDGRIKAELEMKIAEADFCVTGRAMEINRIDLGAHAKEGLSAPAAMKRLKLFVRKYFGKEAGGAPLAGHNVGFDIGFLKRLCQQGGVRFEELFSHRRLDTASILRFLALAGRAELAGAGLDEALKHFGVEVEEGRRHTALGDALATAKLIDCLISLERGALSAGRAPATAPQPSRKRKPKASSKTAKTSKRAPRATSANAKTKRA